MKTITILSIITMMTVAISSHAMVKETGDKLSASKLSIIAIAAFTAKGNLSTLTKELHEGLDAGLTVNEIKEVIVQMYACAGFPRSLNALHTFLEVLKKRKEKGIIDKQGKDASPIPIAIWKKNSMLEYGTENQTRLVGSPVKGDDYEFSPSIDQFLKEHLFGDIFGRDILDYKTREIATISALISLGGTENQLCSHFKLGMHNGLTTEQLNSIVSIIKTKVGDAEGNNAAIVLQAVLKPNERSNSSNESNSNFVGNVFVSMMVANDSAFNTQMASVTFEPGARTNWHYHPSGQTLVIPDGTAFYKEKGKPKQILSTGQVVKCPPNVHHWHGATSQGSMTHTALSTNLGMVGVVWLQKVTDEEYEKSK